jgi:hypothetical protein
MNKGQFPFLENPPNNRVLLKSFTGAAASAAFSDVGRSPWQGIFFPAPPLNAPAHSAKFHCNRFASSRVYISVLIDTFRTRLSRRQAMSRHASSQVFRSI